MRRRSASGVAGAAPSTRVPSGVTSTRAGSIDSVSMMSCRAASEIAITRVAHLADGGAVVFIPIVARRSSVWGKRIQIRSSSVTTVATRGANSGVMFARPCTTCSPRRAAIHGIAPHCAPIVNSTFPGGPCVTVIGKRTKSMPCAQSAARTSSGSSEETNAVSVQVRLDRAERPDQLPRVPARASGLLDEEDEIEADSQGGHGRGRG